jgi:hypothetical protein
MVDVERNRPLGADAPAWKAFLEAYLDACTVKPLVYTYASFLAELKIARLDLTKCRGTWVAKYPQIAYPDPGAESLRRAVMDHEAARQAHLAKGDPIGANVEARAKLVCAQQLSAMGLTPSPLGLAPPNAAVWQWGGDYNASTVAGVRGLCDRSYFLGDEATFAAF